MPKAKYHTIDSKERDHRHLEGIAVTNEVLEAAKWLWGAIVPYTIYLHRKIDKASEDNIKREEYSETIQSLRDEIHKGTNRIEQKLDSFLLAMVNRKDNK